MSLAFFKRLRPWPTKLKGQILLLVLIVIMVGQLISFGIDYVMREQRYFSYINREIAGKIILTSRLVDKVSTQVRLRSAILALASSDDLYFQITPWALAANLESDHKDKAFANGLKRRLARMAKKNKWRIVVGRGEPRCYGRYCSSNHRPRFSSSKNDPGNVKVGSEQSDRLVTSIRLHDGMWLNGFITIVQFDNRQIMATLGYSLFIAIALTIVLVIFLHQISKPLSKLANAAEAFGRGVNTEPIEPRGPGEVRQLSLAFITMRRRIENFISYRMRILAAISHDLRTPITAMRLRAEMIENDEMRDKMIEHLDELKAISEATLTFARESAHSEPTKKVNLTQLVEQVCEEFRNTHHNVSFIQGNEITYPCRPIAIKRAVRNLIENGVRYGNRTQTIIERNVKGIDIIIEDDGPGIAPQHLERVFEPFERVEESRNRETGGAGLGLAISRSILRSHGGDVCLANTKTGGLKVTVHLPLIAPGGSHQIKKRTTP